jgi:hypothetical protein
MIAELFIGSSSQFFGAMQTLFGNHFHTDGLVGSNSLKLIKRYTNTTVQIPKLYSILTVYLPPNVCKRLQTSTDV